MLRIFTDFDGPIIDVSERYYQVYQFCLEQCQHPDQSTHQLSKAEFWQLKRSRIPERQIGRLSGLDDTQAKDFARLRRENVHALPYLIYDRPIASALTALEQLQQSRVDLAVVTMRHQRELLVPLQRYDLERFFRRDRRYCLHDEDVKTNDIDDKTRLLQRALAELPPVRETWMIGDTEADILAAQANQIPAIGVLSGIRDRDQLQRHNPDFIVNDLAAAVKLISQQSSCQQVC
jgi:phosphoglycolate phosphatase-like HAD superfamily hydrolase